MKKEKLQIGVILKNGTNLGLKNFLSIIGALVLYILTIWIPYLNLGTTIAMATLPLKMSQGKIISPLEIFDGKYRKNMGEFLLLIGLLYLIVMMGYMFMIIPGVVMSIAYGYSVYFLIDKEETPTSALSLSNKSTYDYKWNIFLVKLIFVLLIFILAFVLSKISPVLTIIPTLIGTPIFLGIDAYIYGVISDSQLSNIDNNGNLDQDLIDDMLID
jgi:hypothetical protein